MKKSLVLSMLGALALGVASIGSAQAEGVGACLITKNNTNPFFVKMKDGADAGAKAAHLQVKRTAMLRRRSQQSKTALLQA